MWIRIVKFKYSLWKENLMVLVDYKLNVNRNNLASKKQDIRLQVVYSIHNEVCVCLCMCACMTVLSSILCEWVHFWSNVLNSFCVPQGTVTVILRDSKLSFKKGSIGWKDLMVSQRDVVCKTPCLSRVK